MRVQIILSVCAALALSVGVAIATGGNDNGGNSANAKLCQKGGWETVYRSDGTPFASQDDCVSYGAKGGTFTTKTKAQVDCEAGGGQFSTTADPFGGPGTFLWACSAYDRGTVGPIWDDCFNDGGIPNTFFDANGVIRGTSCYE